MFLLVLVQTQPVCLHLDAITFLSHTIYHHRHGQVYTHDVPTSPHTGSIATDRVLAGFFLTKLLGLIITSTAAIATIQPARIMHPKVFRLSCSHLCCGVPARPSLHVDICHCNAMPEKSGALQQAKPDRPLLD